MKHKLAETLEALASAFQDESDKDHMVFVQTMVEKNSHLDIHKPEMFSLLKMLEIDAQADLLARIVLPKTEVESETHHKLIFAYKHYDFIVRHLESVILTYEGHACSADKTRWLIDSYVAYLKTKKLPTIKERSYWHPRIVDVSLWMAFIDSMYELYYGKEKDYVTNKQIITPIYKDMVSKRLELLHEKFSNHSYFLSLTDEEKRNKVERAYLLMNPDEMNPGTIIVDEIGDISYRFFFESEERFAKYGDTLPDWFTSLLKT